MFCQSLTAKGRPCPIGAEPNSLFCHVHDPEGLYQRQRRGEVMTNNNGMGRCNAWTKRRDKRCTGWETETGGGLCQYHLNARNPVILAECREQGCTQRESSPLNGACETHSGAPATYARPVGTRQVEPFLANGTLPFSDMGIMAG